METVVGATQSALHEGTARALHPPKSDECVQGRRSNQSVVQPRRGPAMPGRIVLVPGAAPASQRRYYPVARGQSAR